MILIPTEITHAIAAALAECVTAKGYTSNVGAAVYVGRLAGAAAEAPACFLLPGRQSSEARYAGVHKVTRGFAITAFADLNTHPTLDEAQLADLIIWDVRRCLEMPPTRQAGMAQMRHRQDDVDYHESGGSRIGVRLQYEATFELNLSDPYRTAT